MSKRKVHYEPEIRTLKLKPRRKSYNNVVVEIQEGGRIEPVPTVFANTDQPVYWWFRNASGITMDVTLGWFKNKVTKRPAAPVGWFHKVNWIRLGHHEEGLIGGIITHWPKTWAGRKSENPKKVDRFKYSILVEFKREAINYDPDLEVSPPN